jgi:hypothetical protein
LVQNRPPTHSKIEAKGRRYGVIADTVQGRQWDTGVLIPGITYNSSPAIKVVSPQTVYEPNAPNMDRAIVMEIQKALAAKGFDPGIIDGEYGPNTQAAVARFQEAEGLMVDRAVGPETAAALGTSLGYKKEPAAEDRGVSMLPPVKLPTLDTNTLQQLLLILTMLSKEKPMRSLAHVLLRSHHAGRPTSRTRRSDVSRD